jgi:predicted glycosyltransferase
MFPFGRKKFAGEIRALIEAARCSRVAKVFCSVRDILVTKRADQQCFDRRAVAVLNREFDALLVHADPAFIELRASLSTYDDIRIPIHYTGYIGARDLLPCAVRENRAVVSAGGGRVGQRLIEIAAQSFPMIKREFGLDMLIVTGALGTRTLRIAEESVGLKVVEFVNELPRLMARSRLSISQCGYNTATDVLRTGPAAVFVPFETPHEDEQVRRADHFAALGRSVTVRESDLNVETLLAAARAALNRPLWTTCPISTDGARRGSEIVITELANG